MLGLQCLLSLQSVLRSLLMRRGIAAWHVRRNGMPVKACCAPADDMLGAARQDRKMLGNRYVELFPSSREEATMDRSGRR